MMIQQQIEVNETERLKVLKFYSLLDTLPEKEYDDITSLASFVCETPLAFISLIDESRVWLKSFFGIEMNEVPREITFCDHAIKDMSKMMIVPDARLDYRFSDNPFVTGREKISFYAGVPLVTSEGYALGTLCVLDRKPRELTALQKKALESLSHQVLRLFEARRNNLILKDKMYELELKNQALNDFARVAAHDIKSPLNNILQFAELLKSHLKCSNGCATEEILEMISGSTKKLSVMIDGILEYSKNTNILNEDKTLLNVLNTFEELVELLHLRKHLNFEIQCDKSLTIFTHKIAFEQIFLNLLSNAMRYNNSENPEIHVSIRSDKTFVHFNVRDNGRGIKPEDVDKIFQLFETTAEYDNQGVMGTGIGLPIVRSLAERMGGSVSVISVPGEGSDFEVVLPEK
jgi:signal transduction histidine kinase